LTPSFSICYHILANTYSVFIFFLPQYRGTIPNFKNKICIAGSENAGNGRRILLLSFLKFSLAFQRKSNTMKGENYAKKES